MVNEEKPIQIRRQNMNNKEGHIDQFMIEVQDVSKEFKIKKSIFDQISNKWKGCEEEKNKVVALDKISLNILKGESVAIIGRNGSGKSTLLQVICGTLAPTKGAVKTGGRIAALLELGSGFNPELTGRENIFINGILHGLKRKEVKDRIEKIIDFAEIGMHIDQPLKTYSSGMVVRLAFAVMTHVDADILIIDEALAVGDGYYTQKCMRYIRRFKERGTIVFVSHDVNAVLSI